MKEEQVKNQFVAYYFGFSNINPWEYGYSLGLNKGDLIKINKEADIEIEKIKSKFK